MPRAVHPPFVHRLVRCPFRASCFIALAVALIASGCLDDAPASPKDDWLRLSINAQVGTTRGRTVAIDVFYRRAGEAEELVPLPASPDQVTVEPGTVQVPVTVDIVACLQDDRRVRVGSRENTCPLVVILRLLDDAGEEIDNERIEPEAPAAGETVTLPTVTLREAALVLTPSALTFSVVQDAAVPETQLVAITNGGGGSLGDLSVAVDEAGAEWLHAVITEAGTHVAVQPTTTSLEPGPHTAIVSVSASGAPNSPRTIEVTYEVEAKPTYVLTVAGAGNGSGRVRSEPEGIDCTIAAGVASGTCSAGFDEGKLIFLTAESEEGSQHAGWSGACEGDGGCGVMLVGPSEVTATFSLVARTLTVTAAGTGSGRISSTPAGLDCPVTEGSLEVACSATFDHGTEVTIAFEADEGSSFGGWSGACQGSETCIVTMTEPRAVSVLVHEMVPVRILAGSGSGSGFVHSTPAGIDCAISPEAREGDCEALFPAGTEVTFTASPDAPDTFDRWQGACDATQPTCTHVIVEAIELGAIFVRPPNMLTVTPSGDGSGRIVSLPTGIDCTWANGAASGMCSASFPFGTEVTLGATAGEGSGFSGWSGACAEQGDCVVTMEESRSVGAQFALDRHTIAIGGAGNGAGTVSSDPGGVSCVIEAGVTSGQCAPVFPFGTNVALTAEPGANSMFVGWSGACQGTGPCIVPMTEARTVTATFALVPVRLDVTGAGEGSGMVTSEPEGIRCTISAGVQTGECGASFPYGTDVRLLPSADPGSIFTGWSGMCEGTGDCVVHLTGAQRVTASFGHATRRVTVQATGNAPGFVSSTPKGIECAYDGRTAGGDCVEDVPVGTQVTLRAVPEAESLAEFTGWSGVCSGTDDCVFVVTNDVVVTARFEYAIPTRLELNGNGAGRITSLPAAIDCRVSAGVGSGTCEATFPLGTELTLIAAPDAGSDGGFDTEGGFLERTTVRLLEPTEHAVAATFLLERHALAVSTTGPGRGIVTSEDEGIECRANVPGVPSDCSETYDHGTLVTLTASHDTGSVFTGWTGACSGADRTCTVSMTEARSVTATFDIAKYTLTIKGAGNGNGQIRGWVGEDGIDVIDCTIHLGVATSGTCSAELPAETVVNLEAQYYYYENEFLGWSGACTGTDQCTVRMTGNMEVTAAFDLRATLSVEVTGNVEAHVTSEPGNIDCTIDGEGGPGVCQEVFSGATVVTLTAETPEGAAFLGWGGDCEAQGKTPTCTLTMDESKAVTAAFESTMRFLSVNVIGVGAVTSSPGGISCKRLPSGALDPSGFCADVFPVGSEVVLTATPDPSMTFTGWSGACADAGKQPTCTVTMSADMQVTASFQTKILDSLVVRGFGTGNGWVRSVPDGITCRISGGSISGIVGCEAVFERGTTVRLTASADEDSDFVQWQAGGACAGSKDPVCDVIMDGNTRVVVGIGTKPEPQYTLTILGAGKGSGSVLGPPAFECRIDAAVPISQCTQTFAEGTTVNLTAVPRDWSDFVNWTGACTGTSPTGCSIQLTDNATVVAGFEFKRMSFTSVTAGAGHACGLVQSGAVYCWGDNSLGQIGDGTIGADRLTPTPVSGGRSYTSLSDAWGHNCALTADGAAYCWGANHGGQIGDGSVNSVRSSPTLVSGRHVFTAVTAGRYNSCGLTQSGDAYCWGYNHAGQIGDGTTSPVHATPTRVSAEHKFVALDAGDAFACGVTDAGAVYCWGQNTYGQIGDGSTGTDRLVPTLVAGGRSYVAVSAGTAHACALTAIGELYCWGYNGRGQLGNGTRINSPVPVLVGHGQRFAKVTAGSMHTCGLSSAGAVHCWGENISGSIGDGTTTERTLPTWVAWGQPFVSVSAGLGATCGISSTAAAYCWGRNDSGQMGIGKTSLMQPTPKAVVSP